MTRSQTNFLDDAAVVDQRRAALVFVTEAFAEAILAGIESDSFVHAALFIALSELVAAHGEEFVADFAGRLPGRLRAGEFSTGVKH